MRIYKTELVERDVLKETICDNCKNPIEDDEYAESLQIRCAHDEWGNDSCDSLMEYDCCSAKCFIDILEKKIIPDYDDYYSSQVNFISLKFWKSILNLLRGKPNE